MKPTALPPRARGLSPELDAAIWDACAAADALSAFIESRAFRLSSLVARADKAHRALAHLSGLANAEQDARRRARRASR